MIEPYVRDLTQTAATPGLIEARGTLADFERTTIAVFERNSSSVVLWRERLDDLPDQFS